MLFEGATAYEPGEKSKTEIEDRILQLKERISDQDKLLEDYGSQEEADRIKKETGRRNQRIRKTICISQ